MIEQWIMKYKNLPKQFKASLWFLICSFLQKGISVITTPIFTRILTTEEYGQYSVFNSWLGIVAIFVTLNLYYGVYTQGLVKFEEERTVFSSSMQGLLFTLSLLWTLVYLLFHDFWNELMELTTVQILAMLVMIWATGVFNFWAAEQRVELKYKSLVFATLAVSFAKPVIGIVFVLLADDKVTARILGIALVELVVFSGMFVYQMQRGRHFFVKKFWKHALSFNIPLIPHYLSQTVLNSADRIMIEQMVGTAEAGIYSLAYSISQIMMLFNTALQQTTTPWLYKSIKLRSVDRVSNVIYPALIGIACINLMLIAFAPEVVAIFAPPAYYDAIWIIPPVAMSVYFIFCYNIFAAFEFYFEQNEKIMLASVFGAVLNVILNVVFIKMYGYYAAGYTTLICYIVYAAGHYYFMMSICKKEFPQKTVYDPRVIGGISLAFLLCGGLLLTTYKHNILRYAIISGILLGIVYKRKAIVYCIGQVLSIKKQTK